MWWVKSYIHVPRDLNDVPVHIEKYTNFNLLRQGKARKIMESGKGGIKGKRERKMLKSRMTIKCKKCSKCRMTIKSMIMKRIKCRMMIKSMVMKCRMIIKCMECRKCRMIDTCQMYL